jgi:hypothetical protein
MLSHVSRRKQALSVAASVAESGGTKRVLLAPATGALVITANAQTFDLVDRPLRFWSIAIFAGLATDERRFITD